MIILSPAEVIKLVEDIGTRASPLSQDELDAVALSLTCMNQIDVIKKIISNCPSDNDASSNLIRYKMICDILDMPNACDKL